MHIQKDGLLNVNGTYFLCSVPEVFALATSGQSLDVNVKFTNEFILVNQNHASPLTPFPQIFSVANIL